MIGWITAFVLVAGVPAELSGLYRTQQIEAGAALELKSDGRFQYSLDYGAVSEAAEGQWTAEGGAVRLTSDPLEIGLLRQIERTDAAFQDEPLAVEDGALILQRHDTIFTFYRDDP